MRKYMVFITAVLAAAVYMVPFTTTQAGGAPAGVLAPSVATSSASQATPKLQTLHLRVTAYSSTPDQTDSTPFITANGTLVHDGIVATNLLPFGTKVEIPALFGDKIFTVEDRMNARIQNGMDIWMPTRQAALYFGANYATVVIVSTPAAEIAIK